MLRAVILATIVAIAIGMMIPVATENTEAGAKEQARQYQKKSRAEKFRYRTRFRLETYSASERFKRTVKLVGSREETREPEVTLPEAATEVIFEPEPAGTTLEVNSTRPARSVLASTSGKSVKRGVKKKVTKKRYRKVRRYSAAKASTRKASAGRKYSSKRRTVKKSKRKYTARWWHNYRARKRQEEALAKRKAAMRARREMLQRQHAAAEGYGFVDQAQAQAVSVETGTESIPQFILNSDGTVSLVMVSPAVGETIDTGRKRTLAGVSVTALRRTVIDQMIRENGWVENDYHKEVDGRKVYVVVAKAPDEKNRIHAKTFYFAESQGNIYRVAASAPKDDPEEAAIKSEEMIKTLQKEKRPQQAKSANRESPPQQAKKEPAAKD